jgi:hypothetical protein
MSDADRQRRVVVLLLLMFSSPLWLLLRSWYGFRFLIPLAIAVIIGPYLMAYIEGLAGNTPNNDLSDTTNAGPFFSSPLLYPALALQTFLSASLALYLLITAKPQTHAAFAGRFFLAPGTRNLLPIDLLAVAGLVYCYILGISLPPLAVPEPLLVTNWAASLDAPFIAAGLPAPGWDSTVLAHRIADGFTLAPQPFSPAFAIMVISYVIVTIDAYSNDGLLRYFDWGPRPQAPLEKPTTASIGRMPQPSADTLGAIFARRPAALLRISGENEKGST